MSRFSRYFVKQQSADSAFLDFGFRYGNLSLEAENVQISGSSFVDRIGVGEVASFDFTDSGLGEDVIYLDGDRADYAAVFNFGFLELTRDVAGEQIGYKLAPGNGSGSDKLVFADGAVSTYSMWLWAFEVGADPSKVPPPLDENETSTDPIVPDILDTQVRGFAQGTEDSTFAVFRPGISLTVSGGSNVDTVYVADGATVDAKDLKPGLDYIYMRGSWTDYTVTADFEGLKFERSIDGGDESILVLPGSGAGNADQLVFADGAVNAYDTWIEVFTAHSNEEATPALAELTSYVAPVDGDDTTRTPLGEEEAGFGSPLADLTVVDVRSDIVLEFSDKTLAFADDGDYVITLVDKTDGDGTLVINVNVTGGVATADPSGGTVGIVDGRLVINPNADLDLGNEYSIILPAGLLKESVSGEPIAAVPLDSITFSTIDPTIEGVVAMRWDAVTGTMTGQAKWYDGSSGNYLLNELGLDVDLAAVEGVVVVGRDDVSDENTLVLDSLGRTVLQNFGADDLVYIDRNSDALPILLNEFQIAVQGNGGAVPTILTFSSVAGPAAVFISFADRDDTPGDDESTFFADAFTTQALEDAGLSFLRSFESITGEAAPVIAG
ncbi:hypothetical protein JYT24_00735 [Parvibaculum lavamentivorans]|nr:hypothetical protein [Parvibaculum lavamentivorans]